MLLGSDVSLGLKAKRPKIYGIGLDFVLSGLANINAIG